MIHLMLWLRMKTMTMTMLTLASRTSFLYCWLSQPWLTAEVCRYCFSLESISSRYHHTVFTDFYKKKLKSFFFSLNKFHISFTQILSCTNLFHKWKKGITKINSERRTQSSYLLYVRTLRTSNAATGRNPRRIKFP